MINADDIITLEVMVHNASLSLRELRHCFYAQDSIKSEPDGAVIRSAMHQHRIELANYLTVALDTVVRIKQ